MFEALARFLTFPARQMKPAMGFPVSLMLIRVGNADRRRRRQPSLQCMWQADHTTGRLQSRWTAQQSSEALAIEPDPGWIARSFSERRWYAT